jgi:hypothetical protein
MVFLTELESSLLRNETESVIIIADSLGNTIGLSKLGLDVNEMGRHELITASDDPKRTSDEVILSDGSIWFVNRENIETKVIIRARPQLAKETNEYGEEAYKRMLNSISSALFDATVYLDPDFRLRSVSGHFKSLLSVPASSTVVGLPFKDLISTDNDRERFEMFVETILCSSTTDDVKTLTTASTYGSSSVASSACPVALMLELAAGIDAPINIRIYVTESLRGDYFMGIQATHETVIPLAGARKHAQIKETLGSMEKGSYAAQLQADDRSRSFYEEATESSLFEHPLSLRDCKPRAPPHISLVSIFYRVLNRDLVTLVNGAAIEEGIEGAGWISPLFVFTDFEATREDIVKLLPNSMQEQFMLAEEDGDLLALTRMMEDSTVGNLNVLSWSKFKIPENSAHHFCAISRFILSKLSDMKADDLVPFYTLWMEGYEGLNVFCSSMRATIALAVISCAIKRPEIFNTETQTTHLRSIFSNLVSTTDSFGVTDHVRLPAVYVACVLWARLQLDRGRVRETEQILQGALGDMGLYCIRHPGSQIIRIIRAMACFDLASLAIARGDTEATASKISEMECILRSTHKSLMKSAYSKIDNWLAVLKTAASSILSS